MVRGAMTVLLSAAGAMAVTLALAVGGAPAAAAAAPKPAATPQLTAVQIEGKDIEGTLVVQLADHKRLFDNLLNEVHWMEKATPQTVAPKPDKLGPKYVVTVLSKSTPMEVYDLYPLASGGPRAHRPAIQPSGKKVDGWFYGRLTMSESLRVSGVPLKPKPDVVPGGVGGGIGENIDEPTELDPVAQMNSIMGEMRRLMLLNGAVLMVIFGGLAGIAYMIRRKV